MDTVEEGLPVVRGLFVGTPPEDVFIEQLNMLRAKGNANPYRQALYENGAGSFTDILHGHDAPNVVILMHNTRPVLP